MRGVAAGRGERAMEERVFELLSMQNEQVTEVNYANYQ
jgi:hypothetical protein